jgi:hypothetical protein
VIDVFDEKPSWRAADVYLRKAHIYVVSLRRNGERGWVHTPAAMLDKDVSDRELGGAVLTAVAESAEIQNVIERYEASMMWRGRGAESWSADHPLLKMANVHSYDQFRSGLLASIHVWRSGGHFRLTHLGSQPFAHVAVVRDDPTEEELGSAVRKTFSRVKKDNRRSRWLDALFSRVPLLVLALVVGLPYC